MKSEQNGETSNSQEWYEYELQGVSLGDKRLDWRLMNTTAKLASQTCSSISQACDDWADTKATYRLFANEKTTAKKILQPHQERTRERIAKYELVLGVQDTSFLDYSHHPKKQGMGPIGLTQQPKLRGLVMHSTLMMTPEGLPIGVASQTIWARDEIPKQMSADERRQVPIEEKESFKRLTALDETVAQMPGGTRLVTVGDSESDIFELFNHAVNELKTDLLIRAGQDRSVIEPEVGCINAVISDRAIKGHLKVQVPKRNQLPKREAIVSVRYSRVVLKAPRHLRKRMDNLPIYAVLVQEENPPEEVDPLSWLLLTTVPVLVLEDAIERIQWYRQRWQIEVYHKV